MKTKVIVNYYKSTGKWYTKTSYQCDIPAQDTNAIIEFIKAQPSHINDMSFLFEASENNSFVNNRLVIIQ